MFLNENLQVYNIVIECNHDVIKFINSVWKYALLKLKCVSVAKEANIAENLKRSKKSSNEIPLPRTYEKLREAIGDTPGKIPHLKKAGVRTYLIPTGKPDEPDIILFANPDYVENFKDAEFWCMDGTFGAVPFIDGLKQLVTIMARLNGHVRNN